MTHLLCILTGLALGAVFHFVRTRDLRHAFNIACELNDSLHAKLACERKQARRQEQTIANIQAMLARMRAGRNIDLGESALLPAPASKDGSVSQDSSHFTFVGLAGSS